MLQEILDSNHQSSVVAFLLLSPERSFSAKELSSRLGIPLAKLIEVLADLLKHGLLKSFSDHKERYYLLYAKHPMLAQLKTSLVKQHKPMEDELFVAIKRLGDIKAAFLSGVFTGNPQLPVDLLLVGKINLQKLEQFLANCKKMIGQEVNYSIMTEDEFVMRRNTFDRFIKDIFDYKHIVVVDTIGYGKKKR